MLIILVPSPIEKRFSLRMIERPKPEKLKETIKLQKLFIQFNDIDKFSEEKLNDR